MHCAKKHSWKHFKKKTFTKTPILNKSSVLSKIYKLICFFTFANRRFVIIFSVWHAGNRMFTLEDITFILARIFYHVANVRRRWRFSWREYLVASVFNRRRHRAMNRCKFSQSSSNKYFFYLQGVPNNLFFYVVPFSRGKFSCWSRSWSENVTWWIRESIDTEKYANRERKWSGVPGNSPISE